MRKFTDRFMTKVDLTYEPEPLRPSMARAPKKPKSKDPTKKPGGQAGVTYEIYKPELHNKWK